MRIAPLLFVLSFGCGNDHAMEQPAEPVYYGEVERILRENCVECHSNDPDRLAPFSLEGYDNAVIAAESTPLVFSVMNRIMPPYYAKDDGSCQTLHDSKWLSDEEMSTIVAWTNGDKLAGEPTAATPTPTRAEIPNVDDTLDIGTNYMPKGLADDFRCFVVDPLGPTDQFLTAFHVRPGNSTVVHHVIAFSLADAAAQTAAETRDAEDVEPGYACTNGAGTGTTFLAGWAPGGAATLFPPDTGLLVPGGRKLVIQMHYNSSNANGQPDRTTIDLDLAPTVAKRAVMIGLNGNINLPPREVDAIAEGTLALNSGPIQSARVWGGAIHMHHRGTGAQVHVMRSPETCMLDLDGWSFHWQHMYWYEQPLTVTKGETLRIRCHYDTTAETQTIKFGEGTDEEMCIGFLYVSL